MIMMASGDDDIHADVHGDWARIERNSEDIASRKSRGVSQYSRELGTGSFVSGTAPLHSESDAPAAPEVPVTEKWTKDQQAV